MIANTIIKSVLRKLLVVPSGGTPSTNQYADGLEALNDLIRLWSANSSLIFQDTREEIVISAGDQEFTLGTTGDYVTAKPIEFIQASILDSNYEYPLIKSDVYTYANFTDKTHKHRPHYIYFRNTYPDTTIAFDATTDTPYTLILTSMKELSEFPDGITNVSLPPYYETALKWNLLLMLAPEYSAANRVTSLMVDLAKETKSAVIGKAININPSQTEIAYINGYISNRYYNGDYNH